MKKLFLIFTLVPFMVSAQDMHKDVKREEHHEMHKAAVRHEIAHKEAIHHEMHHAPVHHAPVHHDVHHDAHHDDRHN